MMRVVAFVLLMIISSQGYAIHVDNLYEAAVPVADQNPSTRAAALKDVLREVIVKVTGQSVVPASLFQQSLRIEHMVEQFGYESRQKSPTAPRRLHLWAKLNPTGVKQLIRQAGLPIWPEERPETLIWMAIEDNAGRLIMAEDSSHKAVDQLHQAANQRGLPIILPLMDLQESSMVNFDAIAAMQLDQLQLPSAKYASQHVLVGHIQQVEGDHWRGRWRLLGDGEQVITTSPGPLSDVIQAGVNPLASRIAQQFSSYSYVDSEQYIDLAVDDINGAADYAHSLKYLQSLSLVSQVDVVGVEKRMVNFRLHTRADLAAVLKVIDLGRVLYARDTVDRLVFGLNP
jgi:hypothetical protein